MYKVNNDGSVVEFTNTASIDVRSLPEPELSMKEKIVMKSYPVGRAFSKLELCGQILNGLFRHLHFRTSSSSRLSVSSSLGHILLNIM